VDEALIAEIVKRVLAQLEGRKNGPARRVLVLFSGASAGQHEGLEVVRQLCSEGHIVTVLLSSGGSYLLGEEKLRAAGAQKIHLPGEWIDTPGLVREAELVLVPTLSMNFAAHLALGLLDSPAATLVVGALLAGKPVIAIRDGADPDGAAGQVFAAKGAAPALRSRLQNNLKTLESYGVELVSQGQFWSAVERRLGVKAWAAVPAHNPVVQRAATIVTQVDIANLIPGSVLQLAPGSRLTALAAEMLANMQIRVIYED
jgi:hypothetical protein